MLHVLLGYRGGGGLGRGGFDVGGGAVLTYMVCLVNVCGGGYHPTPRPHKKNCPFLLTSLSTTTDDDTSAHAVIPSFLLIPPPPPKKNSAHDFRADAEDPNRVWFTLRTLGTHKAPLVLFGEEIAPTGIKVKKGLAREKEGREE